MLPTLSVLAALCGNATQPLSTTQKNVLLIGDSISMSPPYTPGGYGAALEKLLSEKGVSVQHAGGNYGGGQCGDTRLGLKCTNSTGESYLTGFEGTFDVIHANWGLHDLADYGPTLPQLPLSVYGANLAELYKRLHEKAKVVMWTTTTPVPDVPTSYNRTYDSVVAYNEEALRSLTAANNGAPPPTNDLWSEFIEFCGKRYTSCTLQLPKNVHLTPAGEDFAAASAAKAILTVLGLGAAAEPLEAALGQP